MSGDQLDRSLQGRDIRRLVESLSRLPGSVPRVQVRTKQVLLRVPIGLGQHHGEEHLRSPDQQAGHLGQGGGRTESSEPPLEETSRRAHEIGCS